MSDDMLDRLERLAERSRKTFDYSIGVDGIPVWNKPDRPDEYTHESYASEQFAPEPQGDGNDR
jgi:hypothetical protein